MSQWLGAALISLASTLATALLFLATDSNTVRYSRTVVKMEFDCWIVEQASIGFWVTARAQKPDMTLLRHGRVGSQKILLLLSMHRLLRL